MQWRSWYTVLARYAVAQLVYCTGTGYAVAQLVKATSQNVAGSIPDGVMRSLIDLILLAALWHSASNRNEYQEYLLGGKGSRRVWLTLSPACTEYLEILGASASCSPKDLTRPVMGQLCLYGTGTALRQQVRKSRQTGTAFRDSYATQVMYITEHRYIKKMTT